MTKPKTKAPKPDMAALRNDLTYLARLDAAIEGRIKSEDPRTYGLPDLLRPRAEDETEEQFVARQNREIRGLIEKQLWVLKDARRLAIKLSPPMVDFIADMFYRRANQAVLWKGRGSGGTLCAAVLVWLCLVYHRMSFTSMAGSSDQAKLIYQYTKSFWECFPVLSEALLEQDPLQTETRLRNGVVLKIISASEKQTRGKHNPGFIVDEGCQSAHGVDYLIQAAMQGAMSEPNYMIIILSTFHYPIGLYQEIWDYAEERGFKRFNWDCFDSMAPCMEGLLTATAEDPDALGFCRTQCSLTEKRPSLDENGNQQGWKYTGCDGKARHSEGFQTRANVILAKKMNRGTDVFSNEYENNRPKWMQPIYSPELIDQILVPETWPLAPVAEAEDPEVVARRVMGDRGFDIVEKSVGIDWGLVGQTSLVLSALIRFHNPRRHATSKGLPDRPPVEWCIGVLESEFMSGKLTSEAIRVLMLWQEMYGDGDFFVYGDGSHPFNNLEVEQAGFNISNVQFAKWKDYGVGNCIKYLVTPGKLFIRESLRTLLDQMKRYRRDKFGKPIKKDDHGVDSWMMSMLHYRFEERWHDGDEVEEPRPKTALNTVPVPFPMAGAFGVSPPTRMPDFGGDSFSQSVVMGGVQPPEGFRPSGSPIDTRGKSRKTGGNSPVIVI